MKKVFRSGIEVIWAFVYFCVLKLIHGKNFSCNYLNTLSPFAEISIARGAKVRIGKRVRIRSGAKIRVVKGAELSIGDNCYINHGCMIVAREQISIGNDVQFATHVIMYDHDHDFSVGLKKNKFKSSPIFIGDECWIATNSVILRGTKLGKQCVVGAGSIIKGHYEEAMRITQKGETNVQPIF